MSSFEWNAPESGSLSLGNVIGYRFLYWATEFSTTNLKASTPNIRHICGMREDSDLKINEIETGFFENRSKTYEGEKFHKDGDVVCYWWMMSIKENKWR